MNKIGIAVLFTLVAQAHDSTASGSVAPLPAREAAGSVAVPPPFETAWKKECVFAAAGLVCATAGLVAVRSIHPLTPGEAGLLDRNSVNPIDRSATYRYSKTAGRASDLLIVLAAIAPAALFTDKHIRESWRTVGLMYLEVAMLSAVFPFVCKGIVARNRPFTYNPVVSLEKKLTLDARASFFSGHTTFAFTSACFSATMYGTYRPRSALRPYLLCGGLLAAATVGALRYECGAHFPTDIAAGALAGCAIGWGVPLLHKEAGRRDARLSIIPMNGGIAVSCGL